MMKGFEFRGALEEAGMTQKEFAEEMGVHRTVIGRQCNAKKVEPYWVYALAGLLATKTARTLTMLVSP
ncbi:MAG: helix-turn-helix domain-containing protein [Proteobacteria bacterium]|nr:helix-turn-helix domain-containing protein [Pseudomonadota bacterium]